MDPNQNNSNPFNLTPNPAVPSSTPSPVSTPDQNSQAPTSPTQLIPPMSGDSSTAASPSHSQGNSASPQMAPGADSTSFPAKAPWQSSPSLSSGFDPGLTPAPSSGATGLDLSAGSGQSTPIDNAPQASSPFSFTPPASSAPKGPSSVPTLDSNSLSSPVSAADLPSTPSSFGESLPSDSSPSSGTNIFGNLPPADAPSSPLSWSPPNNTAQTDSMNANSAGDNTSVSAGNLTTPDSGSTSVTTTPDQTQSQTNEMGANPTPLMPPETSQPQTPNLGLSSDLSSLSSSFGMPASDNTGGSNPITTPLSSPMTTPQSTNLGQTNAGSMPSSIPAGGSAFPSSLPTNTGSAPIENAPTDLSHLVDNSSFMPGNLPKIEPAPVTTAIPTTQSVLPSAVDTQPTASVSGEGAGSGFPKAIIFLVIGVLLIVIAAVAYFVLGVGKSATTPTSIPLQQQKLTNPPSALVPTKAPTPTSFPAASSSANLNNSQTSSSSSILQGSSAVDLLRQNTSTSSAK